MDLFSDRPLGIWALASLFPTSVGLDTRPWKPKIRYFGILKD
jgi:hypothetical protein